MSVEDDLNAALGELIARYGLTRDELEEWLTGPADGGPTADGFYPITTASGAVVLAPSPARLRLIGLGNLDADAGATLVAELEQKLQATTTQANRAEAAADNLASLTTTVTSTNLYDPATMRVDGSYLSSGGGINNAAGWGYIAIPVVPGRQYTISTNGPRRAGLAFYSGPVSSANGISGTYTTSTPNPQTVTAPANAQFLAFNLYSTSIAEPTEVMVNEGATALPYEAYFAPYLAFDGDAVEQAALSVAAGPKLTLRGAGDIDSYIDTARDGTAIRQAVRPWPVASLTTSGTFDLGSITIGGFFLKGGGDDTAPLHAFNNDTLGAGHGYVMTKLTANGHGKTTADVGQVHSKDGAEWVIVGVVDANTLYVTARTSNTGATTGTFTRVSGGTNIGDISATAAADAQMFQVYGERTLSIEVDGRLIDDFEGQFPFKDEVVFRETYGIAAKNDIVEWYVANGEGPHQADDTLSLTTTYRYDRDGGLAIHNDYLVRNAFTLRDIMALQAQAANAADGGVDYYVPKALTTTHEGTAYDFQLLEDAAQANAWSSGLYLTPGDTEPNGILADRMMMLTDTYGFAMGFLPIQTAEVAERRAQVTNRVMEIRNGTRKVYMRLVDKGDVALSPGDYFSSVAYRVPMVRSAERTSAYTVRKPGADFFYVDWHDRQGVDRVPVPSDFEGRDFTLVEARNCTVLSDALTNRLSVDVNCAGDYGYAILRVTA